MDANDNSGILANQKTIICAHTNMLLDVMQYPKNKVLCL
jgi:hypothetical protein